MAKMEGEKESKRVEITRDLLQKGTKRTVAAKVEEEKESKSVEIHQGLALLQKGTKSTTVG